MKITIGRGTRFVASTTGFSAGTEAATEGLGGLVTGLTLAEAKFLVERSGSKLVWLLEFSGC